MIETGESQKGKAVETEANTFENENIEKLEGLTQMEDDDHGNEMQVPIITIAEPVRGPFVESESDFIKKLKKMVEEPETNSIISWSATKESIIIWNNEEFSNTILPKYFEHGKMASFKRQLNNYGFRKKNKGGDSSEYAHDNFQGGQEHLVKRTKNRYKQEGCSDNSNPGLDIDPSDLQAKIESLKCCTNTLTMEIMELKQQIRLLLDKTFSNEIFFNNYAKLMREIGGIESEHIAKKQRLEVPETSNKMGSFNGVENGENRKGENIPVSNLVEDEGVLTEVVTDKTREREQVPNLVENEGVLSEVATDTTNEKKLVSNAVEHEEILTELVTDDSNEKEPISNSVVNEGVSIEVVTDKTKEDETVSNLVEQKVEEVVDWGYGC